MDKTFFAFSVASRRMLLERRSRASPTLLILSVDNASLGWRRLVLIPDLADAAATVAEERAFLLEPFAATPRSFVDVVVAAVSCLSHFAAFPCHQKLHLLFPSRKGALGIGVGHL